MTQTAAQTAVMPMLIAAVEHQQHPESRVVTMN